MSNAPAALPLSFGLKSMLALTSVAWDSLKTPEGSATEVPSKILAFRADPTSDNFDDLWDALTGIGDIQITDAFWPALPHLVDPILKLERNDRELAIGQIGWGVALASCKPSEDESFSCKLAKARIAEAAFECIRTPTDPKTKRYLLAAIAACCDLPGIALSIIQNE